MATTRIHQSLAVLWLCLLLLDLTVAHDPAQSAQHAPATSDTHGQVRVETIAVIIIILGHSYLLLGLLQQVLQQQASMKAEQEQQASVIEGLKADLATYRKDQADTNHRLTQSVAFTVRLSASKDTNTDHGMALGHRQTLVFDDVITNVGSAYDPRHGHFIAPASGTYAFFLTTMSANTGRSLFLQVVKEGSVLDEVFAEGHTDYYDQGSTQVTTQLTTGDQVWVRQRLGSKVRGDMWTVFSGFKLP